MPRATALALGISQPDIATDLLEIYERRALRVSVRRNEQQHQDTDKFHRSRIPPTNYR